MAPRAFEAAEPALDALRRESPDVLITDIRMPGASGLELLKRIHDARPQLPVIVMTAHSDLANAVSAYEGGAFEYLPKPFDIDQAISLVRRAASAGQQPGTDPGGAPRMPELLGTAPAMQQVFRAIGRLSRSSVTVLITGESGTGKELVARALHEHSPRVARPFVPIHCGALPREVLESELFGHEKGAFTGAVAAKPGLVELADGGTLLLDEIGEMEPDSQVKLLRALETGAFFRVGGTRPRRVDIKLVAATNRDLAEAMKTGEFRQDLYFRINTITVSLSPLRERPQDIALLANHFVAANATYGAKRLSPRALAALEGYAWPGNVRELLHAIERAVILSKGEEIQPEDLPPEVLGAPPAPAVSSGASLETMERQHIVTTLRQVGGHRGKAAALLAIDPKTLYRKIIAYGIAPDEFR